MHTSALSEFPCQINSVSILQRSELALNSQVGLVVTENGGAAYLKAGGELAILPNKRELFSFGSGMWCDGPDAVSAMSDSSGSWLKCHLDLTSQVILERKKISSHLAELPCLDKSISMKELLMALEDQGEATGLPSSVWMAQLSPNQKAPHSVFTSIKSKRAYSGESGLFPPRDRSGREQNGDGESFVLRS